MINILSVKNSALLQTMGEIEILFCDTSMNKASTTMGKMWRATFFTRESYSERILILSV